MGPRSLPTLRLLHGSLLPVNRRDFRGGSCAVKDHQLVHPSRKRAVARISVRGVRQMRANDRGSKADALMRGDWQIGQFTVEVEPHRPIAESYTTASWHQLASRSRGTPAFGQAMSCSRARCVRSSTLLRMPMLMSPLWLICQANFPASPNRPNGESHSTAPADRSEPRPLM